VDKDRVSALANIPARHFPIKAHYVFMNCTVPTYWTRFQTPTKAAPEMMAFLFLTSWKMSFSDISDKLAVFKFQEP